MIIDDLFDVSSILTGKFTLNRKEVNFIPIVQSAIDSLIHEAAAKSITIKDSLNITKDLVYGDSIRLRQIVLNLISNSIKFTPEKGEVEISLSEVGKELELKVADNGIGIDKEFLPYVFEKFRQTDSSTTRSHGGLGLGLALVRQLTEMHNGTVSIASEGTGKGAVFTVILPLLK